MDQYNYKPLLLQIGGLTVVAGIGLWSTYISHQTHTLVNSRMTELLSLTRLSAQALGQKIEVDKQQEKEKVDGKDTK